MKLEYLKPMLKIVPMEVSTSLLSASPEDSGFKAKISGYESDDEGGFSQE